MGAESTLWSEVSIIAASAGSFEQRAQALLTTLHCVVPYDAAWIAIRDPVTRRHRPVGQVGNTTALAQYFALPEADEELEEVGLNRLRPPMTTSELPMPLDEYLAWGEYLLPAGFRDGLGMGLFTEEGRHLGFLTMVTGDRSGRMTAYRGLLGRLRPSLSLAIDRLPSLVQAAQWSGNAVGATVLTRGGRSMPIPGVPSHHVFTANSKVAQVARRQARTAAARSSFLCPWAAGLVRISVLNCRDETADHLCALVTAEPAPNLDGLRYSDLCLLGALLEGWDHDRIHAAAGGAPAQLDEIMQLLGLDTLHALLLYAAREGLYIPPGLWL
jgi:hypothetical protein